MPPDFGLPATCFPGQPQALPALARTMMTDHLGPHPMKYRPFGQHGFACSEIGFGGWAIGGSWGAQADTDSLAALHRALDLGVNFIDTAAGYGDGRSERLIGQVLRERHTAGKKESIFVAT